ncbi:MAG: hypothetical protein ACLFUH_11195 [Bacteroidales bacterium]
MSEIRMKYYPVDNGDTSLITLSDETKILIDINITNDSEDEENKDRYDVRRDLLDNELKKDGKKPYVDIFILSHPDEDHCRNFKSNFFLKVPEKYTKEDEKNELIIINELWYSPKLFERLKKGEDLSSDAEAFKKEANRRMELYKSKPEEANKDGNRVRVIGYSDNPKLNGLEDRIIVPGNTINVFNDEEKDDLTLFIHAPLKDNIKQEERNGSSIVFQARFNVDDQNDACLAFWGGDAGWKIWEQILNKSNDNDLAWDLFLAPHHCSWTFFNDNTDEGKKKPQDSSLQILDKKREGNPKVISSSKEIKNDKNPPSVKAKNQYVNKVKDKNFWVTSEHSNTNPPEPIEFEITNQGPDETISNNSKNSQKEKLIGGAAGSPKTYG